MKRNLLTDRKRRDAFLLIGVFAVLYLVAIVVYLVPDVIYRLPFVCISREYLHINCPFCGMTRDFVLMAHGSAPIHNPFSAAVIPVVFLCPVLLLVVRRMGIDLQKHYALMRNTLIVLMVVMTICNNISVS